MLEKKRYLNYNTNQNHMSNFNINNPFSSGETIGIGTLPSPTSASPYTLPGTVLWGSDGTSAIWADNYDEVKVLEDIIHKTLSFASDSIDAHYGGSKRFRFEKKYITGSTGYERVEMVIIMEDMADRKIIVRESFQFSDPSFRHETEKQALIRMVSNIMTGGLTILSGLTDVETV